MDTSLLRAPVRPLATLLMAFSVAAAGCSGETSDKNVEEPASLQLVDVASDVGLTFEHSAFQWEVSADPAAMMGGGLCWLDYDADGWLDLYLTNMWSEGEWGRWNSTDGVPHARLYRNVQGEFEDVTDSSGLAVEMRGNGCVAADLDLDGLTDLFVTSDRFNALFWNNGDGTFTDGATDAGITAGGWHTGAVVGDLSGDGWPDLFVAGYADLNNRIDGATTGFPNTFVPVRDLLYVSEGPDAEDRVTFSEVGEVLELDDFPDSGGHEYGLGGVMADLDRDGDLDLYVANDTKPNRLYENIPWPGGVGADPAGLGFRLQHVPDAGVDDDNSGMGVAAGDYTGDGLLDLFVTNLGSQLHSVYVNETQTTLVFSDGTSGVGSPDLGGENTGWGASWGDLDLDTDVDLLVANGAVPVLDLAIDAQPVQAFSNLAAEGSPGQLSDVGAEIGLSELGPLMGRGSALADFDNDGDLDVAINSIGSPVVLLENRGASGNWLVVDLEGFHPGAEVTVTLATGEELTRVALAGSSYLSSEDPRIHFGLGSATTVEELRITWPDGSETVHSDVDINRIARVAPPG